MNLDSATNIKLVIWDLDETFWRGTLSEEGITPIARNIALVETLAKRGIISSIVSKNDHETACAALRELGVWDYFVLPQIAWQPKGEAIGTLIEDLGLRAVNCLFIDDNPSNLAEAAFFNEGLQTALPEEVLPGLLDLPTARGKDDSALSRLNQYKLIENKFAARAAAETSNEDFLRSCNIRISFDYDVDASFDRVLELIERTNQLNYTKKRLGDEMARGDLRRKLAKFGVSAACIRCADDFGDYGIVGFYLLHKNFKERRLEHFVFSCRTMNMGVEQFVYEFLGKPDLAIAEPVSYGLDTQSDIDWIRVTDPSDPHESVALTDERRLLLLGSCELLQLSAYFGHNCAEYVNYARDGQMIRSDCPGLVLSDPETVERSSVLKELPAWQADEFRALNAEMGTADVHLLSLGGLLGGHYIETSDGLLLRQIIPNFKWLTENRKDLFKSGQIREVKIIVADRVKLLWRVLETILQRKKPGAPAFLLKRNTSYALGRHGETLRQTYNDFCDTAEARFADVSALDIDTIIDPADVLAEEHLNRQGYQKIATAIRARLPAAEAPQQRATAG